MLPSEIEDTNLNKRIWGFWATAGFGAVIMATFFIILLIIGIIVGIVLAVSASGLVNGLPDFTELLNSYLGLITAIAGIVTAIVGVALILIIIKVRRGDSVANYLGLKTVTIKAVIISLAVTIGYVILLTAFNAVFGIAEDTESMVDIYTSSVWPALFWISVVVFAPIFEEMFVRGFLFKGFSQSRIGLIGTICLTSLVWAALHVEYGLYGISSIFVFGIILGIARYKTGSLWSPILMHAFYNALVTLTIALEVSGAFN